MFWPIFRFELGFHARQPMIYVVSLIFFLLAFASTVTDTITVGMAAENININSPMNIILTLGVWSFLAMFGCVAYATSPVLRDHEFKVAELFLTTGIGKFDYLVGRFSAALVFCVWLYLAALLGMFIGEFMPWLDPERLGPLRLDAYWRGTWLVALPNILFVSTLVFVIAVLMRSVMACYAAVIALLMASALVGNLVDPEQIRLLSMLDPFGMEAIAVETRYWTPFEQNSQLAPLSGNLLANRILVVALTIALAVLGYTRFRFSLEGLSRKASRRAVAKAEAERSATDQGGAVVELPRFKPAKQAFGGRALWQQLLAIAGMEVRNIFMGKTFLVFASLGILLVVANAAAGMDSLFGTAVYPTTAALVSLINGAFSLPLLIVLVFYSSELLSRDCSAGMNELVDSMPYPNGLALAGKLLALMAVVAAMLLAVIAGAMLVQLAKGFTDIDPLQYLVGLFLFFQLPLWLTCVIALFFQVLTGNKYLGMLFTVLYLVALVFLPDAGYDQYLYIPNIPPALYSDFTGYDLGLERFTAFAAYWGFFAGLLLIVTLLLWPRGTDLGARFRLSSIRNRFSRPVGAAAAVLVLGFGATGAFSYYNIHILNEHVGSLDRERLQAEYEKAYKRHEKLAQPSIAHMFVEADIYPERKEAHLEGWYTLVNDRDEALSELHVSLRRNITVNALEVEGGAVKLDDRNLGYAIYTLEPALQPGESRRLSFDLDWLTPGFANEIRTPKLLSNGTFFDNSDALPIIGYNRSIELEDNNRRRKYELGPVARQPSIDDEAAWQFSQLGASRRSTYEAVVSTAADQIAVTPGYLVKDWEEGGRRYFHYRMEEPIWPFVSFMSGRYKTVQSKWQDVNLEVYYHHDYNVQRMLEASQKSLAYFSESFSPYQYQQYRIFEFPAPIGSMAQAFPNTIPFSESIGFVADIRDPEDIDYVFYVTAHELAHQWWAHQVIGADVQGATVLTETLAQYSALMVMEQEYGEHVMQRFLRYELDRYLSERGSELIEELPLALVENQPYIHYRKGSLVLYALQDYLGADVINEVLSEFISEWGFKSAPFPTSRHLVARLREAAGPEYQETITDLFEKIVIYDLKVEDGAYTRTADGRYEVTFDVAARKYEANGRGEEKPVPVSGLIDIAVLGEPQGEAKVPEVLYLKKHRITRESERFTIQVDQRPQKVGIDPYNKLVDRNPRDNQKSVSEEVPRLAAKS
ncbi:ABC transporter permease/M1 family aminopeptidase [Gilvimarinus sp. F26214L]|uniref:ABC transporter permease/M1 family aminopeptidase n=1 Tax=Gilvimarinus sp. DZF01 TaxID=3461371 RepID=UPI0040462E8D